MIQEGKNLGERMSNALDSGLIRHEQVVLIGSDLPELDSRYLRKVLKHLSKCKIVVGPAIDGGFGLIAVKKFCASIFNGLTWGGPEVFSGLMRNIRMSEMDYFIADRLWDVDVPADFARYQKWLSKF